MFALLLYALCTYIIYHFLCSDVDIDELGAEKDSIGDDDDDDGDDDDVVRKSSRTTRPMIRGFRISYSTSTHC